MISAALASLRDELNAFMVAKGAQYLALRPSLLSDLVNQNGESMVKTGERKTDDNINLSLIALDKKTTGKDQVFCFEKPNGTYTIYKPKLQPNLYVLFSVDSGVAPTAGYSNCLRRGGSDPCHFGLKGHRRALSARGYGSFAFKKLSGLRDAEFPGTVRAVGSPEPRRPSIVHITNLSRHVLRAALRVMLQLRLSVADPLPIEFQRRRIRRRGPGGPVPLPLTDC